MKRHCILSIIALFSCFASFAQMPITGATGTCVGGMGHVADSTAGGVWSSSTPSVATVGTTGNVYGVSAGTTTITYTVGSAYVTSLFTVTTAPAAITGTSTVCPGGTTVLADATPGGTWSSVYTSVATVNSGGTVFGIMPSSGTSIRYTVGPGCYAQVIVTVLATTPSSISGDSVVCVGSTITLHDTTTVGMWSSSAPGIATVIATSALGSGSTTTLTGVSVGTATITYSVTNACGTFYSTYSVDVLNTTTPPAAIAGPSTVATSSTINLTDATTGGTWSITPTSVATISASGVVTGVSAGTAIATYTVNGCGGAMSVTHTVTVTAFDGISGHVNFLSGAHTGPVKIWLIRYVSPFLTAIDSVTVYSTGTSVAYQFLGAPTDSFRIKAAPLDSSSVIGTSGYIPTYHISSFYWNGANVFYHTSGTSDINKDINMSYGTVTTGPGFVAGDVSAGANKGTTTSVPVKGLMMYIFNSTTLQLMQAIRTDATGHYSFSNLPVGATYYVFPDSLNYFTTPCTGIALTTAVPSVTSASFKQHTVAKTITPIPVGVGSVSTDAATILAFPNPTNGRVNIAWTLPTAQLGAVSVCDVTGREVYSSVIDMTAGTGISQVNISSLTNGLYTISVKSAAVNYINKIQVQH
ncbi:hypothetical protein CJD36_019345 [Flavipsychrobacter stenotrophus]|uniref:Secretion system C-terminal sorting domain-containing protein n=1 Tax=Flavipsychrobacter stenotrophus TaxID=2077091 RepID=A0A2S7SRZ5_9BACT|nr:T9SS type A sorting domain-containing protein [Flavipsychrobacter stenotrophus]PQJ09401.1 hypothetical protein CJD36_019345 [Flavipsychrobacter stenotrophus]